MNRSTVQPFRRNNLHPGDECPLVWLKFSKDFTNSFESSLIKVLDFNNPDDVPVGSFYKSSGNRYFDFPKFDSNIYTSSPASAFFSEPYYQTGKTEIVVLTGVDERGNENLDLNGDFTIDFDAIIYRDDNATDGVGPGGVPSYFDPYTKFPRHKQCLFDWGGLKFFFDNKDFEVELPNNVTNQIVRFYEPMLLDDNVGISKKFHHFTFVRDKQNDTLNFYIDNKQIFQTSCPEPIVGYPNVSYSGVRTIGSTISGTNQFLGFIDEFRLRCEKVDPTLTGVQIDASGVYFVTDDSLLTYQNIDSIIEQNTQYFPEFDVVCGTDPVCFVKVKTAIDPRYSSTKPLPYEIRWYKDGVYIATSKDSVFGSYNDPLYKATKYSIGNRGLGELKIKDFSADDYGLYNAEVLFGPNPNRPINVIGTPPIFPILLRSNCQGPNPSPCSPSGSCFEGETKVILSNKKNKRIKDISTKDEVLGFKREKNGSYSLIRNKVKEVLEKEVDEYYELSYPFIYSNIAQVIKKLNVTAEHPFYIGNGNYKEVKDLNIGDIIYVFNNKDNKFFQTEIIDKKLIKEKLKVYNLSVSNTENFFAENVAVHNKSICLPFLNVDGKSALCSGESAIVTATLFQSNCAKQPLTWVWDPDLSLLGATVSYSSTSTTSSSTITIPYTKGNNSINLKVTITDGNGCLHEGVFNITYEDCTSCVPIALSAINIGPFTADREGYVCSPKPNYGNGDRPWSATYASKIGRNAWRGPNLPNFSFDGFDASGNEIWSIEVLGWDGCQQPSYKDTKIRNPSDSFVIFNIGAGTLSVEFANCGNLTLTGTGTGTGTSTETGTGTGTDTDTGTGTGTETGTGTGTGTATDVPSAGFISCLPTGGYGCKNACTASQVTFPPCVKNFEFVYWFYRNKNTFPGETVMKSRGINFTDQIIINGNYDLLTYQDSTNYNNSPDKLIISKDIFGSDSGKTIEVRLVNSCGPKSLPTRMKVLNTPVLRINSSRTNIAFGQQSTNVFNPTTNQTQTTSSFTPTSIRSNFSIQPRKFFNCAFCKILINGQQVMGTTPTNIGTLTNSDIIFSNNGVSFNSDLSVDFFPDRTVFPNFRNTVTLEIYSNLQDRNNFITAKKTSITWVVRFLTIPRTKSPTIPIPNPNPNPIQPNPIIPRYNPCSIFTRTSGIVIPAGKFAGACRGIMMPSSILDWYVPPLGNQRIRQAFYYYPSSSWYNYQRYFSIPTIPVLRGIKRA